MRCNLHVGLASAGQKTRHYIAECEEHTELFRQVSFSWWRTGTLACPSSVARKKDRQDCLSSTSDSAQQLAHRLALTLSARVDGDIRACVQRSSLLEDPAQIIHRLIRARHRPPIALGDHAAHVL